MVDNINVNKMLNLNKILNMNKIEFEYEGVWITNPHYDETGRFEVNPEEYYGKVYLNTIK